MYSNPIQHIYIYTHGGFLKWNTQSSPWVWYQVLDLRDDFLCALLLRHHRHLVNRQGGRLQRWWACAGEVETMAIWLFTGRYNRKLPDENIQWLVETHLPTANSWQGLCEFVGIAGSMGTKLILNITFSSVYWPMGYPLGGFPRVFQSFPHLC